MSDFELFEPDALEEVFDLLDGDDPSARPMGGGTALMLMMKAQLFTPSRLVSLRRAHPRFFGINLSPDGETIAMGGMTTFADLEHSALIARHLPVVTRTMKTLANVRVRNVATIGGNLAHGDPHLDMPPVWTALDAELTLARRGGERVIPVAELFAGYYETTLAQGELIVEVRAPVRPSWRMDYIKVTTRAAHDWPALGIALGVLIEAGKVSDCRIVLSASTDRPTRLMAAEAALKGSPLDAPSCALAADAAANEADIGSDDRGSADYKTHLLRVHLSRALLALAGE
jgi:carbon-monoxide dehydrogenase medium subunit